METPFSQTLAGEYYFVLLLCLLLPQAPQAFVPSKQNAAGDLCNQTCFATRLVMSKPVEQFLVSYPPKWPKTCVTYENIGLE